MDDYRNHKQELDVTKLCGASDEALHWAIAFPEFDYLRPKHIDCGLNLEVDAVAYSVLFYAHWQYTVQLKTGGFNIWWDNCSD